MTPIEAGKFLELSPATLANYRSLGTGPAFAKVDAPHGPKRVTYNRADLIAWRDWSCASCGATRSKAAIDVGGGGGR